MGNELNNNKLFCKLWNKNKNNSLVFISSNSGTGKTTYFKWLFLRRALYKNEYVDFIYRWQDDLEKKFTSGAFLTPPPTASKRLLKLASKLDISVENETYFIIEKETKRKIAQGIAVNTQSKLKSTENELVTKWAMFDEILADDGRYAPNECYKFARLIDTRARYRQYKVFCLYNNVSPFFPYKEYFKNTSAKFIDFVTNKYNQKNNSETIQDILSKSKYGEIYNNNNYLQYEEFYKNVNTLNCQVIFYLKIFDTLFAVKDKEDFYIMTKVKKIKKNKEIFSINLAQNDYVLATTEIMNLLKDLISNRLLFVNNKKYTIYIKELANELNLCYIL